MNGKFQLKESISKVNFGYNAKMEVYANLSSDITKLYAIGLRQEKSRCNERNITESELTTEMKERNVCKHTKSHIEVIEK